MQTYGLGGPSQVGPMSLGGTFTALPVLFLLRANMAPSAGFPQD